ncbi:NACHT domain-containing NTPase [Streptomyces sp. Act143]|uniref:NACHT domain-containing protein n=1 Tax=Streptomyces sp. Act143 TaxID=2200760 RepID=UPI0015E804BA|nr:NACHT domain-containing protein [Streptomyces sp. Act143]
MGDQLRDWLPAAGAFVLGVLVLKLKDWLKLAVDRTAAVVYRRLAGSALLRRTALRRYTVKLYERHARFSVSFRPDEHQAMDMASIYVPLRAATGFGTETEHQQAEITLRDCRRAVVLGAPGAGKTMLLRHTVLAWAHRRYRPELTPSRTWYDPRRRHRVVLGVCTDVPVLLPLHSVDLDTDDLIGHIVDHFAEHDFPNARTWVERALADGRLALYFDGLDEVPTAQRARIVHEVRRFLHAYDRCRMVVTCRIAVYRGEFADEAIPVVRVEEFDDRLIQRFLYGWPWPSTLEPDTVEQLLGALHDTPQLMPLARNPLLLTMIAYLYSYEYAGTGQALPHNRTDFYDQVTVSLLRDRQRDARFAQPVKRAALRRLALAAQDVPPDAYDRLAVPSEKVLSVLREVLERYGRPAESAEDMLGEIVDRSGLLLSLDNGERFQFAHLTLQEYLAAMALGDEPDMLLERYRRDPEVWRETVRLWCGAVTRDCSDVVREVLAADPLLAFQCLADAHVVDDALADGIVSDFHSRLVPDAPRSAQADAVVAAFGLVAADRRPRGLGVFALLCTTAETATAPERARLAVQALVATRSPRAARFLASRMTSSPDAQEALVALGDVAVGALREMRDELPLTLVARTLWMIRTPRAVLAMGGMLDELTTGESPEDSWHLAFLLADLLKDPEAAEAMRNLPRSLRVRRTWLSWSWVWEPYSESLPGLWLSSVPEMLVALLHEAARAGAAPPEATEPDPRLVMPLVLVEDVATRPGRLRLTADDLDAGLRSDLDALFGEEGATAQLLDRHGPGSLGRRLASHASPAAAPFSEAAARADLARRVAAAAGVPDVRVRVLQWLRPELCVRAVQVLMSKGIATRDAWESGSSLLKYDFATRLPVLLPFYFMLSVAPGAKTVAIVREGRLWGVQGWLSVVFLALSLGSAAFLLLGKVPLRRLWSWSRPVRAVRLAFWIWFVFAVPVTCLLALAAWWGTWKSLTVGLLCFAGVLWVARPMARRQALADLLDDELPLLIRLMDRQAPE